MNTSEALLELILICKAQSPQNTMTVCWAGQYPQWRVLSKIRKTQL